MMAGCRRFPSDSNCSLTLIGEEEEEEEVVRAASEHAVSVHGHHDGAEVREQIRGMLEPEGSYRAGATREPEALPG